MSKFLHYHYSPLAVKNLGALFTINAPVANWYIAAAPQVQNNSGFITDTVNWVNISGCFTALGGENYITIGNFNSNASTDTAAANPVAPLTGTGSRIAYYYIDVDSVCLYQNNFPTAIKDLDKESDISIYPNPVTTSLNISYKRPLSKDASIEIINYLGQPVYLKPFSNQIDLSAFSSGIYFLTIQDGFFKRKIKIIKK